MALTIGTIVNQRYRIVRLLGEGGFGAVYRAWDTNLSTPCAVKESYGISPDEARQFLREAQMLANLRHPGLPKVTDHFSIPGQGQYLVMELVEGEDLEKIRTHLGGRLTMPETLTWILQILDAVEYLHKQKPPVIHRDIKPANIRITPQGQAILVDFGIAKRYDAHIKTTVGARAVTEGYSPIEQYGQGKTDERSDIYAIGATLYTLLTGKVPPESIQRTVNDRLVPPDQLISDRSVELSQIILKALKIDRDERWQSVAELRVAIRKVQFTAIPEAMMPRVHPTEQVASLPRASMVSSPNTFLQETQTPSQYKAEPSLENSLSSTGSNKSGANVKKLIIMGAGLIGPFIVLGILVFGGLVFFRNLSTSPTSTPEPARLIEPVQPQIEPIEMSPPKDEPIRIGLLAPLSGQVPTFGISTQEGVEMAVKEWNDKGGINGKKIELIVADSQCSADPAVNAANKLIDQDGVKFIVGDVCSSASIPVSEITNPKGIVQISPTSTNANLTIDQDGKAKQYIFRACFIDPFQGLVMAKFASGKGYKTAFIMLDQGNDYVRGLAEAFEESFTEMGGQVVGKESYTSQDTDFSAILTKVNDSKAEVLYLPDYYNIVNLVGAQAKDKGVTAVMMGGDGWDSSDLDLAAAEGGFYSNHYYSGDTRQIVVDWLKRYGEAFKDDQGNPKVPDALATLGYDAANLLFAAIEKAGPDDTAKVAEALAGITWEGVSGQITFDAQHNPIKSAAVIGVAGGATTFIESIAP